ncbi:hypothetical protein A8924_3461 [Saccharopolyspora erythraea NRRL 2338]|uniref:Uncharacterized protein n=2 Tax=Saccharopolyspora erythraea TaxID=1836 RepID=A4FE71_SACEN|nr:hypothetical protein [Saccharopolyspora erythraea]EQD85195.1 hypothetical protein N599_16145 [Saccharopolyspora erythraea D]PFG96073.1 hypothetical protein A8924_3461 [Saccharopolyspora erythraea NRRL 2338]CAM02346.1 hypothetical protein SACE_3068 [Saccharopolyspora erythraea NRRL 2338]
MCDEIHISRRALRITAALLAATALFAVLKQLPEIRRYIKSERM